MLDHCKSFEVMRKGGEAPRDEWVALLLDVDPDLFVQDRYSSNKSQIVNLGLHGSREDAWDRAEQLIAVHH